MPFLTEGEEEIIISGALPAKGELIRGVMMSGAFPVMGKQEQQ